MRLKSRMPLAIVLILAGIGIGAPVQVSTELRVSAQGSVPAVSAASMADTFNVQIVVSPNPTMAGVSTQVQVTTSSRTHLFAEHYWTQRNLRHAAEQPIRHRHVRNGVFHLCSRLFAWPARILLSCSAPIRLQPGNTGHRHCGL